MTGNFENNVILTSQHPHAILTINWPGFPASADPSLLSLQTGDLLTSWTGDACVGRYAPSSFDNTAGSLWSFENFIADSSGFTQYVYSNAFEGSIGSVFFLDLIGENVTNTEVGSDIDAYFFIANDACIYDGAGGWASSQDFNLAGNWSYPYNRVSNILTVNETLGYTDQILTTTGGGPYRLIVGLGNATIAGDSTFTADDDPPGTLLYQGEGNLYIDLSIGDASYNNLYVNGKDIGTHDVSNFLIKIDGNVYNPAPFFIYTTSTGDFEYNAQFNVYYDEYGAVHTEGPEDVSIFNRPFIAEDFNIYETAESLIENESSYLLLRSNPKYSGNIKLVIDTSQNMFLDTFKVSEILSNKKYRKQNVSGNSILSGDISRVFKDLPLGEMYKVESIDTKDISKPKTEYVDQYNTTYNYGARLLTDELYEEHFSLLAPLWVNSKLPDYFAVFRLPGSYNEETYEAGGDINGLATKFLKNSKLIKSWSFKENSPLGNYLDNHLVELAKFDSPLTLSLNEYDPNSWVGITVDSGVIAQRSEIPYFFQKDASSYTKINAFVSQGFERLNLLCPNLLNLDFIFDDYDVSTYSMNRYFGLYLKENPLYQIAYYKDSLDGSVNIISIDGKDVSVFIDSSVFDNSGNIADAYKNRIFVINDGKKLERITNSYQLNIDPSLSEDYSNRLGNNIFNTPAEEKEINSFITFKLNDILNPGEHLRIINESDFKVWEVYGSDTDVLNAGECWDWVSTTEPSAGYPKIYRTVFSTKGNKSDQVNSIYKAFKNFENYEDNKFTIGFKKDDSLSIIINESSSDKYSFQRITSNITDTLGSHDASFNSGAQYNDISFYKTFTPDSSDFERVYYDSSYGPVDFEFFGDRLSLMINMYNHIDSSYYAYSFDSSIAELFTDIVMYQGTDGLNRRIKLFDVSTAIDRSSLYLEDPTDSGEKSLIITNQKINLDGDTWWGYDIFTLNISLMGINCVKDFDFTIYDSNLGAVSNYMYSRNDDVSMYQKTINFGESLTITERNSYEILSGTGEITINSSTFTYPTNISSFNTFFNSATITPISNTTISYISLDGSYNFEALSVESEENLDDYYADIYFDASQNYKTKKSLKYSLTTPTITKWGGIGKDVRNNDLRLNLTTKLFTDTNKVNSNFIPVKDTSLYQGEISYPIFKYLSGGDNYGGDYIYYDVNDIVDTSYGRKRIRDLIFEYPNIDIVSKILYNSKDISGKSMKSSIAYYNLYRNSLKSLIKGVYLELRVLPIAEKDMDIKKWDSYRISFISSPSRILSNKPIEVIINENTRTILIIWYQGNEILNYTKSRSEKVGALNTLIEVSGYDKNFARFTLESSTSYTKSPYIVDTGGFTQYAVNIYDNSTYYNSEESSPFLQFNYNTFNDANSIFCAPGTNYVDGSIFTFSDSFDTFDQTVDYSFFRNNTSYGLNIINFPYIYKNNDNYYKNRTNLLEIFEYFINANNVKYSLIKSDRIITSDDYFTPPIKLNLINPIEYKAPNYDTSIYTYNGNYSPIFKNILNFNDSDSISNIVEKDFIFSNTDLTSYNNINQLWYNRVVETVTSSDSSNNIAYKEFNPFYSQWDNNYYTLVTRRSNRAVDGFKANIEKPSFFGSKLVLLPDELIMDQWDTTNTNIVNSEFYHTLEYNLTKTIIKLFRNNEIFLRAWENIANVTDEDINEYIIKLVENNYWISQRKVNVEVWSKPIYKTFLAYQFGAVDQYDTNEFKKLNNIDSWFRYEKGEYILRIRQHRDDHLTLFTKVTLNRK